MQAWKFVVKEVKHQKEVEVIKVLRINYGEKLKLKKHFNKLRAF